MQEIAKYNLEDIPDILAHNPIAILTADWHVSERIWADRNITGDSEYALEQIGLLAKALDVSIIAAGDLINVKHPLPYELEVIKRNIVSPVYYVQGQHEMYQRGRSPWLSLLNCDTGRLPFIHVIKQSGCHKIVVRDEHTSSDVYWGIIGLDWTPAHELQDSLDQLQSIIDDLRKEHNKEHCDLQYNCLKVDHVILVMHQTCQAFMGTTSAELKNHMLPTGVDMVIIGDYHEAGINTLIDKGGNTIPVISPGATHMRRINELGDKSVYVLCASGEVLRCMLKTRCSRSIHVPELTSEKKLVMQVKTSLQEITDELSTQTSEELKRGILYIKHGTLLDDNSKPMDIIAITQQCAADMNADNVEIFYKDTSAIQETYISTAELSGDTDEELSNDLMATFREQEPSETVRKLVSGIVTLDVDDMDELYNTFKEAELRDVQIK